METRFEPRDAARFLRTLRVATGVAVAREDLRRGRSAAAPAATFLALAAKTGDWRFPDEGLISGDGLLLARLVRESDGSGALVLQAQGAAGVSAYAGRPARARAGEAWFAEGAFDRFGMARLAFAAGEFDDAELARIEVELIEP